MRKSLLLTLLAIAIPTFSSFAAIDGAVFVVPVNADGTATANADGSYRGQISMASAEGQTGLTARQVYLDHGFVFLAVNGDASKHTFYTSLNDEISFDSKNPLMIETDLARHIDVPEGSYNITFYPSTGSGSSFAITTHTSTGVGDVMADADAEVEYYDMQGRRVGNDNPAPGLYIARRADKAYKVLVK